MLFGIGITIAFAVPIGVALLLGEICHLADLEKDPLDRWTMKRLNGPFLRADGETAPRRERS